MSIIQIWYTTQFRTQTFPRIPWKSLTQPSVSEQHILKTIRMIALLSVLLATEKEVTQNINYQDRLHQFFRA